MNKENLCPSMPPQNISHNTQHDSPQFLASDMTTDEKTLEQLLCEAINTSGFDVKTMSDKIGEILEVRLRNELVLARLLSVGVDYDKIGVQEAAGINNKSTPIPELVKIKQLLDGMATSRVSVVEEEELRAIRGRVFDN